jgi:hypothetical protein
LTESLGAPGPAFPWLLLAGSIAADYRFSAVPFVVASACGFWSTDQTYSSWSHDMGVPGKVVAQLMGHASVDTTLNVYTQVLDRPVPDAVEKIGGELITIVHNPERAGALTH